MKRIDCRSKKRSLRRKFSKSKELNSYLEEELASLHEENVDLSMALSSLEAELSNDTENMFVGDEKNFTFQTKLGRKYSPSIQKLYYTLLSAGVLIVKCFNPTVDVSTLSLPQQSCASYMRKEELKVISDAQKASIFCETTLMNGRFHLNTDGTTKQQKNLGAVAINDIVISAADTKHRLPTCLERNGSTRLIEWTEFCCITILHHQS